MIYDFKGHIKSQKVTSMTSFIMKLYIIYDSKGHIKSQKVTSMTSFYNETLHYL